LVTIRTKNLFYISRDERYPSSITKAVLIKLEEIIWSKYGCIENEQEYTVLRFRFDFTAFKESAAITKTFNSTNSFDIMSFMTFNDTEMTEHI